MSSNEAERLLSIPPLRAVLTLAVPTSAVMVIGATSGVLHTYFVSRLGADAIAAVSLVFPITLLLMTMMGGGVGAGVSAAIAQALGARRSAAADSVASHALWITVALAAVLTSLLLAGAPTLFRWMGGQGEVHSGATRFARVLFGGSMITFVVSTFDSILRGSGNVRVPSIWATVSLVLQILLTPLFMFTFDMGLVGAAAATLTGQLIGAIPRAWILFSGAEAVRPRLVPVRLSLRPIRDILRVGIPASLATLTNYVGLMFLTTVVARYGRNEIAAFGLGTRLDFFVLTLGFGVGSAVLTLVGLAFGAGDPGRVGEIVRRGLVLVLGVVGATSLLLVWKPTLWLGIFTADAEITSIGSSYLRLLGPTYPFVAASMIFAFAFQGLGRAVYPLVLMIARTALVVVAAAIVSTLHGPVEHVFLVMALGNAVSTVLLGMRLRRVLARA